MKYWLISDGNTGRAVAADAFVVAAGAVAAPVAVDVDDIAAPLADSATATSSDFALMGAIKVLICVRVNGPRRYDMAQRLSKTSGPSSCTLFITKIRAPSPAS